MLFPIYYHFPAHVEVKEQLAGIDPFLPPGRSQGPNSGRQAWQQVPLPNQPTVSPQPKSYPKSSFLLLLFTGPYSSQMLLPQ